jgi:DNA mismatch repair protein MutS2
VPPPRRSRDPSTDEPTLDLHGVRVEEALRRTDAFLRAERARGSLAVRVITGHGTGALKQAVRDMLGRHPAVTSWQPAFRQDAATIAVLRAPERRT